MPSLDEFVVPRVLLAMAVIVVVARLMGRLFARFHQPPVVGEIVGGILLGPTLLGLMPGHVDTVLFPEAIRGYLSVVANLGLVTFMFLVGLELDFSLLKGKARSAATISVSSIVLPFTLGIVLALWLHTDHRHVTLDGGPHDVGLLPFALFVGASMSVTAFPVLARILVDRGMYRVPLGAMTMAAAAVDDVLAWSLLAVVIAVVDASGLVDVPIIVFESALFVVLMFAVVRPLLGRLVSQYRLAGTLTSNVLAIIVAGYLASSFVTAEIGIHQIFGAFLFGAAMPRGGTSQMFDEIRERLEKLAVVLLLPVFFVATGLKVDATKLGVSGLATVAAVITVACVGKFVGATVGARACGVPLRKAGAIGVLMNTRGLTELVILGVGLEKGVLDTQLFTALVIMAVFTTVITEPVLRRFYDNRMLAADVADVERRVTDDTSYRVLVHIRDADAPVGVDLAAAMASAVPGGEVVLANLSAPPAASESDGALRHRLSATARSLEALHHVSGSLEARGVRCSLVVRSVEDLGPELLQLAANAVDVVVVQRGAVDDDAISALLRDAPCDLAVLPDGAGGGELTPIAVAAGRRNDDRAALEVAVRTCLGLGVGLSWSGPLAKVPRQDRDGVEELGLAPIEAVTPVGTLFIGGPHGARPTERVASAGDSTTVVIVRSRPADERTGLQRLVEARRAAVTVPTPIPAPALVQ
jgi:Kef-type K+ transport system membrane component KefB